MNTNAARRPRLPSEFNHYFAEPSEAPAEVEGFYASYQVEYADGDAAEQGFTAAEEAFFHAGDQLSDKVEEELPTTRFAPSKAPAPPRGKKHARKPQPTSSARGRRLVNA